MSIRKISGDRLWIEEVATSRMRESCQQRVSFLALSGDIQENQA